MSFSAFRCDSTALTARFASAIFVSLTKRRLRPQHVSKKELLLADSIILIFMLFPSIVREILGLFSCESRGPDLSVLSMDLGIKCYEGEHIFWMAMVGTPALITCGVLLFGGISRLRFIYRGGMMEDVEMVRKYGFLYRGYEENFW